MSDETIRGYLVVKVLEAAGKILVTAISTTSGHPKDYQQTLIAA